MLFESFIINPSITIVWSDSDSKVIFIEIDENNLNSEMMYIISELKKTKTLKNVFGESIIVKM